MHQQELTFRLCFVKNNFAWFTDCPLTFQWGDDWDKDNYEYNAGLPYDYHNTKDGVKQKHRLEKVYWTAAYITPDCLDEKSNWSVKSINKGNIPWLSSSPLLEQQLDPIYSGITLNDFISFIQAAEGQVFIRFNEKIDKDLSSLIPKGAEGDTFVEFNEKLKISRASTKKKRKVSKKKKKK